MDPQGCEPLGRHGERFKWIRSLADRRGRAAAGRFLVEGGNGVAALLAAGAPVDLILVAEPLLVSGAADGLLATARGRGVPLLRAAPDAFARLAASDAPAGLLAVAPIPSRDPARLPDGPLAWIERCADPGNLGSCLRSLAFFGFAGLLLGPGSADPWSPKAVRATAGAFARMVCLDEIAPDALFALAAARNLPLVAYDAHGGAPPDPAVPPRPALLVFGPETGGLSRAVLDKCAEIVTLTGAGAGPSAAGVESLNLAAAVALAAFLHRRP